MSPLVPAASGLIKMIYSSAIAGVTVAVVFSVAVLGVIRSGELRREHRGGPSAAYAAVAVLSLLVSTAIVIYGLVLVTRKS